MPYATFYSYAMLCYNMPYAISPPAAPEEDSTNDMECYDMPYATFYIHAMLCYNMPYAIYYMLYHLLPHLKTNDMEYAIHYSYTLCYNMPYAI